MVTSKPLQYVRDASMIAFFTIGFGYVITYFLKVNSLFILFDEFYFRLADGPLLFSGIVYFFLTMRLKSEKVHRLTCLDTHAKKDFFLEEAFYIFVGTVIFFTYFAIDLLG